MKYLRNLFSVFLVVLSFNAHAQKNIYVLLNIDDISIEPTFISNVLLKVDNKDLALKYRMGRLEISDVDYNLLKTFSLGMRVTLCYTYTSTCPTQNLYNYSIEIDLNYLFQDYLILRVFNFKNYPKVFVRNEGYGVEFLSPIGSTLLPKRIKKIRRNPCLN